jgi:hypothetical protein
MKRIPNGAVKVMAAVWLVMVLGVMVALLRYSASSGAAGAVPHRWPAGSRISFDTGRPNLVLFAHPRCPCTRATLGELEVLMARCQGKFGVQVWFIRPADAPEDWADTALWRKASSIPGVVVRRDEDMAEARRFGAETSGQTLLYDRDGELLFQGGITVARGHSGDNAGRGALEALVEQRFAREVRTPVFGCPLFASDCQQGGVTCKP